MQARVIASCFALAGFAAVVVIGLYLGNPASTVLIKAILVGVVAFGVGAVIGHVAQATVEGYVERYKSENPMPDALGNDSGSNDAGAAGSDSDITGGQ